MIAPRLTTLSCLFHNRWRHRLDGSDDLRFWRGVPKEQVSSPSPEQRVGLFPRRALLTSLPSDWYSQCLPGSGNPTPTTSTGSPPTPTGGSGGSGLHAKFKAKGKLYFGTEIDHYHLSNNPLTTIVKNSFGQVTHENSLKWDAIERECFSRSSREKLGQAN